VLATSTACRQTHESGACPQVQLCYNKSYELKLLPPTLDEITKRYLLYVAGQATVSADELRKRLVNGGGSLDDFTARGYLVRQGQCLAVATPGQRSEFHVFGYGLQQEDVGYFAAPFALS